MAERSKFQFRMRDLLWAVSLIGVAMGGGSAAWRLGNPFGFVLICAGVGVGASIGCFYQKPFVGAAVGASIVIIAFILLTLVTIL